MKGPKNVIWISTDHLRYDCVGANGNPAIATPHIDSLAAGGVSFDRCYANNPLCMPSRASFMTGCYPQRTGVTCNGRELSPDFAPTVARVFGRAGFHATQIGKLHFQNHEDRDLDPRERAAYGFDRFMLSEEPGCYEDAYRIWLRGERPDLVPSFTVPRPMTPDRHHERERFKVIDAPWRYSHSGWVATQFSNSFAAWGVRPERQFYHLGFYAPHPPLNPTIEMFAPYREAALPPHVRRVGDPRDPRVLSDETLREYRRHFYAMVTGVDFGVGEIIRVLKETGAFDDTLIVFCSDHGDACGDHGKVAKDTTFLESIMHLPLILHWPAGLGNEPRRIPDLFEMVDLLPTLADLCGIDRHPLFQGRSIGNELLGGTPLEGRQDAYAYHEQGDAADLMLRTETHKLLAYYRGSDRRELLFDLRDDPDEMVNRADDPACVSTLRALRDRLFERTLEATRSIRPRTHLF